MNRPSAGCGEHGESQRRGLSATTRRESASIPTSADPQRLPAGCGEHGDPQRRGPAAATNHESAFASAPATSHAPAFLESITQALRFAAHAAARGGGFANRRRGGAALLRFAAFAATCLLLAGCTETRFESPLGDNIESCDVHWKGLWLAQDGEARERGEGAFLVDDECRFQMLDQTEPGTPFKRIHVPLNFVHDGGNDYLVIADVQLKGLVTLPAPYAISPTPEKSIFFARDRLRGERLEVHDVDSERIAKLILDAKLEGTIAKSATELHVYVRGNRQQMLEIVRTQPLFADKATVFLRSEQSVEAYEKSLLARQRKEKP